jgi:cystathionine gamma-lyase
VTPHADGTRVVRAGLPEAEQGAPFLPGPVFAGPFHLQGEVDSAPWGYTRYGNPTWERYEAALAELEGGEVVLFASGMAAAAALLLTTLRPGSAVAIDRDCYLNVRRLARTHLEPRGVEVRLAHHSELLGTLQGAAMVWLESPSNPKLEVYDIAALADAARGAGALTVVDNTTAGPLSQKVLDLGADCSLTSATKHLSGHADLMLGYVATRDADQAQALRDWRRDAGAIPGPFETWLAHRSLPTLALRMERAGANALALAELLSERDDVIGVRYPGLPGDLAHEVARRQMTGFGSVIAFDLGSRERAERFLATAELVTEATSFGSVHTTAERRLRWGGDDVPEGFIRLSAGCEETADLVADVERALDALRAPHGPDRHGRRTSP